MISAIREFLRLESASGMLLLAGAALAIVFANTPLAPFYDGLLSTPVEVRIGELQIAKPLLLWINDGLMAVFFFLVGLELKREVLEGELSQPAQVALPAIAALGGIVAPALIYVAFNRGDDLALSGWAIPAATDIAFALGVLALLGSRVPTALKIFLMTLAILDDLGAILIIAIFYSSDLSLQSLLIAAAAVVLLAVLNRIGVKALAGYVVIGIVLWVSVLKSGVHATLAGVVLAAFIPLRVGGEPEQAPLRRLEHGLHPWVAYGILPLFAFANAGVSLHGLSFEKLLEPVPLGIALGLFLGKQLGVFGFTWLAVKARLARLPSSVGWAEIYGVSVLCGIGFTMSLFIGSLAFEHGGPDYAVDDRLGILLGSILSAVVGYFVLKQVLSRRAGPDGNAGTAHSRT
jgi:NhaA family Na+:H+ antiporter